MRYDINIFKGIAPGKLIGRELEKRSISQRAVASELDIHSQTLNAVIMGRRQLTTELALKLERELDIPEGFLLTLQAYYNIEQYKRHEASESIKGIPNIRKILFWDTDFDKIDWGRYKNHVVERVMERGNEQEKQEIMRFYGLAPEATSQYVPSNSYKIHLTAKR
ncbi:hypothetical protein BN938_2545 [Mucinivorans hirudinis]|uniref:HTH cro/C1-type domain-containing protein n=1 Tax=Mucinivorans hirudinis TaxID=1433126 RepID=A0A060RAF0_9BACT|nr:hypothetical protein BN938_2545 [Mucinivorans hirudinis]